MEVPTSGFTVAALIVLALPGIVYAGIRRWLRGELHEDRNFGVALARGVVLSILFAISYLLISDGSFPVELDAEGNVIVHDWKAMGLIVLVFFIGMPAGLALTILHRDIRWVAFEVRWLCWLRYPIPASGHETVATAWDFAVRKNQAAWVRICRGNKEWVGGWVTRGSYSTTYPDAPSIYIDQQFVMLEDGQIGEPLLGTGVWVSIVETDVVSWQRVEGATNERSRQTRTASNQ